MNACYLPAKDDVARILQVFSYETNTDNSDNENGSPPVPVPTRLKTSVKSRFPPLPQTVDYKQTSNI